MNWQRSDVIALGSLIVTILGISVALIPDEVRCSISLPSESCNHCVSVSSRDGWTNFDLEGSYKKITTIDGDWSVDDKEFGTSETDDKYLPRVGASGHSKADEEAIRLYEHLKYDSRFPLSKN